MFRLDRLVIFVVMASGALISFLPFETNRVWRRGELNDAFRKGVPSFGDLLKEDFRDIDVAFWGLLSEEFLEVISSFRGDAARCCPLADCAWNVDWCGGRRMEGPEASFSGGDIASFELFALKNFGRLSPCGGLVLNDDLLLSSSSRPSCV